MIFDSFAKYKLLCRSITCSEWADARRVCLATVAGIWMCLGSGSLSAQESAKTPSIQSTTAAAIERLKAEGKLANPAALSASIEHLVAEYRSDQPIPLPKGAKVLSYKKHSGDIVHTGDVLAIISRNGRRIPVLATEDGVFQSPHSTSTSTSGSTPTKGRVNASRGKAPAQ